MANTTTNATSFSDLDEWLGAKQDRPYAHNTRAQRRSPDAIAIRLHRTDVVTFYRDGRVRVATGGWETNTTFDRIRGALPFLRIDGARYLYRCEAPAYTHPTNDAERAQAIDGLGPYGALDCTFHPDDLPVIRAMGRSLTMTPAGAGRHHGEARVGGRDGPVAHYAAVQDGGNWIVYRSEDPDTVGEVVGGTHLLREAKRLAWEDAHSRGLDV